MSQNKKELAKNKIRLSPKLLFSFVSGLRIEDARAKLLEAMSKKAIKAEPLEAEGETVVYELRFLYSTQRPPNYQLCFSPWANGEMTHIQFFKRGNRNHEIRFLIALRALIGLVIYAGVFVAFFFVHWLALVWLFGAAFTYTKSFWDDLAANRETWQQDASNEEALMTLIDDEMSSEESPETPESLRFEDKLEKIINTKTITSHPVLFLTIP